MSIFEPRTAFKPFDYPDVAAFKTALQNSFWLVGHWSFTSDAHDFRAALTPAERQVVARSLLAISQVEVSVKRFWAKLGDRFPKPEIEQAGAVCAESEVRHADAYSHLLEVLGLNGDFEGVLDCPPVRGRVEYLAKYLRNAPSASHEEFCHTLALFSVFVENVSLFSQFLVVKAFNKYRNVLKDVDNVIQATAREELLHFLLGVRLLSHVRDEFPGGFGPAFHGRLAAACRKAYAAECGIVDWIFEGGDLPFLPAARVKEFVKARFNESLVAVGGSPLFEADPAELAHLRWFDEEMHAGVNPDFFHKRPVTYSVGVTPVTADDLF